MIDKRPARIAAMFDAIAPRYDFLNHLLSFGLDRHWRRQAIRALRLTGREHLLDLCSGTGDLAFAALAAVPGARRVTGVDLAGEMLRRAQEKARRRTGAGPQNPYKAGSVDLTPHDGIEFVRADAARLPLADASVDACAVAFGLRNVEALDDALLEVRRVLRPGGRLAILEFGAPRRTLLGAVTNLFVHRVVPLVGRAVSGHGEAYRYLPDSLEVFPRGAALVDRLHRAGYAGTGCRTLAPGLVYLYQATRPPV